MLEKQHAPLAIFIREHAERSGLSYDEIGVLCGFRDGKLIRSFADGKIRPPLDRITALAGGLGCDKRQLFRLAFVELFSQHLFDEMRQMFAEDPCPTSDK